MWQNTRPELYSPILLDLDYNITPITPPTLRSLRVLSFSWSSCFLFEILTGDCHMLNYHPDNCCSTKSALSLILLGRNPNKQQTTNKTKIGQQNICILHKKLHFDASNYIQLIQNVLTWICTSFKTETSQEFSSFKHSPDQNWKKEQFLCHSSRGKDPVK